jgi:prepilin-type N-terminal cleavage/methylation domain-containing protein/prepilin-type processing-associated H-X9-DG protein
MFGVVSHRPVPACRAGAALQAGRAFTLVELLVVIGIIAVLVSILMPALTRARNQAATVQCLSNLRQLQQAQAMYNLEFKNRMIPAVTVGQLWHVVLKQYLGSSLNAKLSKDERTGDKIYLCPMASEQPDGAKNSPADSPFEAYMTTYFTGGSKAFGTVRSSYGINRYMQDPEPSDKAAAPPKFPPTGNQFRYFHYFYKYDQRVPVSYLTLANSTKMGDIPMFFDSRWRETDPENNDEDYWRDNIPANSQSPIADVANKRHGKVTNVAFADGSARTIPLPELWELRWHAKWVARSKDTPPKPAKTVPW